MATAAEQGVGYWGAPDSTIDFCEANYAVTYWVAEFFNTLSSLPMIAWGLLGLILTQKYATNETRFKFCFMALMFIGFGSTLFHASLRFKYQMLDEMPMLVSTTVGLYVCLTLELPPGQTNWKLAVLLVSVTVVEIILYLTFEIWPIFFIGFAHNIAIGTYVVVKHYRHLMGKYVLYAIASYYIASVFWFIDMFFCDRVQRFHLHSLWHFGAGYGSYLGSLTFLLVRARIVKKRAKVYMYRLSDMACSKDIARNCYIDIPIAHYCKYSGMDNLDDGLKTR